MYAVIMAGGGGTRLWPMVRRSVPKPLQKLVGDKTLIEQTYERITRITDKDKIYLAGTREFKDQFRRLLPEIKEDRFLLEPEPRNTGPAIARIASYFAHKDPQAIVATFASDHVVQSTENFTTAIPIAAKTIAEHPDHLMVVGIKPTFANPGLGYIQADGILAAHGETQIFKVKRFIEKPDVATAEKFIQSWQYFWNAGYFIFQAAQMLKWFKEFSPQIYRGIRQIERSYGKKDEQEVLNTVFKKLPAEPTETEVVERLKKILVVPVDFGVWSDVGKWDTLHSALSDITGYHMVVKGHHVGHDDENCLILGGDKMIATIGLKDTIIVDTPDVLLIANRSRSDDVKKIIEKLKAEGKHLYL